MRINVRLSGSLRRYIPDGAEGSPFELEVADGTTVSQVMSRLGVPAERAHMATVDGEQVDVAQVVREGQEVSLFPPLAGGC